MLLVERFPSVTLGYYSMLQKMRSVRTYFLKFIVNRVFYEALRVLRQRRVPLYFYAFVFLLGNAE